MLPAATRCLINFGVKTGSAQHLCYFNMTLMHGREQSPPPPLAAPQVLLGEVVVIGVHCCVSIGEEKFPGMFVSLWSSGHASRVSWLMGARWQRVPPAEGLPGGVSWNSYILAPLLPLSLEILMEQMLCARP